MNRGDRKTKTGKQEWRRATGDRQTQQEKSATEIYLGESKRKPCIVTTVSPAIVLGWWYGLEEPLPLLLSNQ